MLTILFMAVFGLAIGSFLNVIIFRWNDDKGFVKGRSHCSSCHKNLELQDLVPLVSFSLLKGKCRYCGKPISWQYPLVELATGIIFALMAWKAEILISPEWDILGRWQVAGLTTIAIEILFWLVFVSFSIALFVLDLKYMVLPNKLVYPVAIIALVYAFVLHSDSARGAVLGMAVGLALFGALYLFSKGKAMGGGDVKIMLFLGPLLRWPEVLVFLFIAFVSGGLVSFVMLTIKKLKLKTRIPFGVFMLPAFWATILWGADIVGWYLDLIQ